MGQFFTLAQPGGPQWRFSTNDTFFGTPCIFADNYCPSSTCSSKKIVRNSFLHKFKIWRERFHISKMFQWTLAMELIIIRDSVRMLEISFRTLWSFWRKGGVLMLLSTSSTWFPHSNLVSSGSCKVIRTRLYSVETIKNLE